MKERLTKGSIFKDGKFFYYKTLDSETGKQYKRCTYETNGRNVTAKVIKKIRNKILANIGEPVKPRGDKIETVSEMLDKFYTDKFLKNIANRLPEKQKKQASSLRGQFKHLKRHLGHMNPKALNMNVIDKYIDKRRAERKSNGQPYADGSIRLEITMLKSAVKVMGDHRFKIKQNMGTFNDYTDLTVVVKETTLEPEQLNAMIFKFQDYDKERRGRTNFGLFLELLYFLGVRHGQLRLLEFDEINFNPKIGELKFPWQKTKHLKQGFHNVYVDHVLLDKLIKANNNKDIDYSECDCPKAKDCKKKQKYVFCNEHKRCEPFQVRTFTDAWKTFCEDLQGQEDRSPKAEHLKHKYMVENEAYKDGKECAIHPHDIRRTRIYHLINRNWDRKIIMNQTGHRSHATFDNYLKTPPEFMHKIVQQFREKDEAAAREAHKEYQSFNESMKNEAAKVWDSNE